MQKDIDTLISEIYTIIDTWNNAHVAVTEKGTLELHVTQDGNCIIIGTGYISEVKTKHRTYKSVKVFVSEWDYAADKEIQTLLYSRKRPCNQDSVPMQDMIITTDALQNEIREVFELYIKDVLVMNLGSLYATFELKKNGITHLEERYVDKVD